MARTTRSDFSKNKTSDRTPPGSLRPHITVPADPFRAALQVHQQGDYAAAAETYRRLLDENPEHVEALHLLGVIDHQRGDHEAAIEKIGRAVSLKPDAMLFRKNLAAAYWGNNQCEAARRTCEDVLAVEPGDPTMLTLLGRLGEAEGKWTESTRFYQQALNAAQAVQPDQHHKSSDVTEIRIHLADCYSRVSNHVAARETLMQILEIEPKHLIATHNIGREFQFAENFDEAIKYYKRAIEIDPACASAWNNLGVIHQARADYEQARSHLEKARQLSPKLPDVHNNLANVLEAIGVCDEVQSLFETAIRLRPDYPEAHHSLSQIHLRKRNFASGWDMYRWRMRKKDHDHRHYNHPEWNGTPAGDRSLLIYAEQGVGDLVMFSSCVPDVLDRVGQVTLETDSRMVELMRRTFPSVRVIPRPAVNETVPTKLPGIDLQIAIADLPGLCRRTPDAFPRQSQLLKCDPALLAKWQSRYTELGSGLKVGISWFGGKNHELQARRQVPLIQWQPILETPDVHFVNLQYGDAAQQRAGVTAQLGVPIHDWPDSDPLGDLDDFTAKVAGLDLVISIDNATVHFAGGVGVSTWCLLSTVPDWRWGENCTDTLWYESLHLFRQAQHGQWAPVISQVAQTLGHLTKQFRQRQQNSTQSQNAAQIDVAAPSQQPVGEQRTASPKIELTAIPQQAGRSKGASTVGPGATTRTQTRPRCVVVSPIGPGHEQIYEQAERSIRDACRHSPGSFRLVTPFRIDDPAGQIGRSRARNLAVRQAADQGFEWVFFLDADDLLVPTCFENVTPYLEQYDAIWGQIYSFQDGTNQAQQRDGQLGQTDRFDDVLNCDPFHSLQMGHFVRTEIALKYPFDETLDAGEDFDYYLRVWENQRCIKLDKPLFANRRGCHSSGPRSATGRDWTVTVNEMLQRSRQRRAARQHSPNTVEPSQNAVRPQDISSAIAAGSSQPELTSTQQIDHTSVSRTMKVAIYGMMRSGTTLLGDQLTVPGEGLILLEPNIHLESRPDHLRRQLEQFGIRLCEADWTRGIETYGFQAYFDRMILPQLTQLNYWGVKMVNFTRWEQFLQQYPAEQLVLCVRDIRDVILSALDLAPKLAAAVDADWIEQRALETAQGLAAMARRADHIMRYEQFCKHPEQIGQLAQSLGLTSLGQERPGLAAVPHRLYENEKHAGQVTTRSVNRYTLEPPGPARDLADRVWRQCTEYCDLFGYPTFPGMGSTKTSPQRIVSTPDIQATAPATAPANVGSQADALTQYWQQDQLANIIPQNDQLGEFPEGWDVRPILSELVDLQPGQKLLEIGCGYGRLCDAFSTEAYLGVDINPQAIEQAQHRHPQHQFQAIEFEADYPPADQLLVYTVLLHVDDLSIGPMLERMCTASPIIVIAEILGRQRWRRTGNPPVFNRDQQDYETLLADCGYRLESAVERPYLHYPQTNISFLKFVRIVHTNR